MDHTLTIEPAQYTLTTYKPDLVHTSRSERIERDWRWVVVFVVLNAAVLVFADPLSAAVSAAVTVAGYFIGRRMEWKSITTIERHS